MGCVAWPRRGRKPACRLSLKSWIRAICRSIEKYADCLQIGARSMQNFALLKEVGRSRLPVLLKRGLSAKHQ